MPAPHATFFKMLQLRGGRVGIDQSDLRKGTGETYTNKPPCLFTLTISIVWKIIPTENGSNFELYAQDESALWVRKTVSGKLSSSLLLVDKLPLNSKDLSIN